METAPAPIQAVCRRCGYVGVAWRPCPECGAEETVVLTYDVARAITVSRRLVRGPLGLVAVFGVVVALQLLLLTVPWWPRARSFEDVVVVLGAIGAGVVAAVGAATRLVVMATRAGLVAGCVLDVALAWGMLAVVAAVVLLVLADVTHPFVAYIACGVGVSFVLIEMAGSLRLIARGVSSNVRGARGPERRNVLAPLGSFALGLCGVSVIYVPCFTYALAGLVVFTWYIDALKALRDCRGVRHADIGAAAGV